MAESILTTSLQETDEIAINLVTSLVSGTTICLYGPMAAGKTTFTQSVGKYFGISRVTSPTYLIMREYPVTSHPVIKRLFHLDLYRLTSPEEIRAFDLEEIWNNPENLVLIEWPEILEGLLPEKRIDITIKSTSANERQFTIIYR